MTRAYPRRDPRSRVGGLELPSRLPTELAPQPRWPRHAPAARVDALDDHIRPDQLVPQHGRELQMLNPPGADWGSKPDTRTGSPSTTTPATETSTGIPRGAVTAPGGATGDGEAA
jgi:hypothetical protein